MAGLVVFKKTRLFSVWALVVVIVLSVIFSALFSSGSAPWQVWLAVAALAIGIPHGALDHLVTVPGMETKKLVLFVSGYLSVVAVAVVAILIWPREGFILVVAMSAVHFGMGDASFVSQSGGHGSEPRRAPWWVYAIPAGSLPVFVPLTNQGSAHALALVNPTLVSWHLGANQVVLWVTVIGAAIAIVWLVVTRHVADARDLVILALLALLTPPLIAFAAYFGLWHALRHTARLSQEIPPAQAIANEGKWVRALWRVSVPGLPALVGTMVVAAGITFIGGLALADYLWIALALVWGLTVPHMALTWRLDREALGRSQTISSRPAVSPTGM